MKDRLKGLVVGDQIVKTGFSRVIHGIFDNVSEHHDIVGVGVNYKGDPHQNKYPVYPAILGGDLYGMRRLTDLVKQSNFDYIFILNDVWVIDKYLETLKNEVKDIKLPKIFVYFPVDGEQHSRKWYENFGMVTRAFTYTEFGKKVVKKANPNLEIGKMPHGVDTKEFYKKFESKREAKINCFGRNLEKLGNPDDMFVVLSANRNQPRKKLDITMEGFSLFAKDKPDTVKLYMHCGVIDASVDIIELSERYGIDNRLIITSVTRGVVQVPESQLNDIYNACDVGVNSSMGEGWGLTSIEHAVTGAPQVVPNHSALTELYSDCGLLVEPITNFTFDNSMQVGKLISPEGLADKLQILYDDRKLLEELGEKGLQKFTQKEYHWDVIAKDWQKIFEEG